MADIVTRKEMYLAYLAGEDVNLPEPITREEQLLYKACLMSEAYVDEDGTLII